jgi:hypothetical protein
LKIYLTRKHTRIEQINGNATDSEEGKYSSSKFYWERKKLGTAYQVFMDANVVIEVIYLKKRRRRKSPKS